MLYESGGKVFLFLSVTFYLLLDIVAIKENEVYLFINRCGISI